jgi:hypothetical protein
MKEFSVSRKNLHVP